jgi:hypothetical protein
MSYWKEKARTLKEQSLSPFGQMLKAHLKANQQELYQTLLKKGDLLPFLLVQQENAKDDLKTMVEQGTPPALAREQVLSDLMRSLEPLTQEVDPVEQEVEESVAESVVNQWLKSQTPAQSQQPKLPPTPTTSS